MTTPLSPSEIILRDSKEYSIYTCQSRGIPSIEDGLKHVQRIALWLLRNKAEKIKTVGLGGMMASERLYVHGDVSATDAIGKLAAPYKNNVMLIEGLGQFGSRVAPVDGIGAPRYTEVRRSKAAEAFLYNDLDLVPTEENYDGSNIQPVHFIPLIPTVLLNGVSGVAVGWSTDILPRSLKSLIQATQDALMDKPIKNIPPHYEKYGVKVKHIAGNQWEIFGSAKILDTSTVQITELPPGEKIESFRLKLIKMEDDNDSPVNGFIDRSTDNIDITVKFKRGFLAATPARVEEEIIDGKKHKIKIPAKAAWTEADVIKFFKLSEKTTERIVVVDWGGSRIKMYSSAEDVIQSFVKWRLAWYTTRFNKYIADSSYELLYWETLDKLFTAGFAKKLGSFNTKSEIENEVIQINKKLDEKTVDRIINLPTYRWNKDFHNDIKKKITDLKADIVSYKNILSNEANLKKVYFDELENLKSFKVA